MTRQSCTTPRARRPRLLAHCYSLALVTSLLLQGCGGGYDGGKVNTSAPNATASSTPVIAPVEPTPTPLPSNVVRRQMEKLDRGLVAVPADKGIAVSWRLLGTDSVKSSFVVYKNGQVLKDDLTDATFYLDLAGKSSDKYRVATLVDGIQTEVTADVSPWDAPFMSIPINKPEGGEVVNGTVSEEYTYTANDASPVDLDGDGQYEIILKWDPTNSKDNSQDGATGNVYLDAYKLDGKMLWRIDLGPNIRAGAHYTQFIAYDFDGDGRAELAVKTADGTVDGQGTVIGDAAARYRGSNGKITDGPEFLTMFDGLSGEALDTIPYRPARGNQADWGDSYGNRVDRFLGGVAYLDGQKPSLIMARGYYERATVAAFDWVDGKFAERWFFDTLAGNGDEVVFHQGAHSLSIADVDGDGKDEIIYGAATIDDNGHALYSTDLCHGDALHVGDLDPARPGLEVFMVHETPSCYSNAELGYDHGVEMHDAANGEILWSQAGNTADVGRGASMDLDPRYQGNESWGSRGGLVAANGTVISSKRPPQMNFGVFWDGDILRELLDDTQISKWDYRDESTYPLLDASLKGARSNNGTKATPTLSADIFGDWREEVIWRNATNDQLLIFSSPLKTAVRMPTLMHDAQYRAAIAWQNVAYNQPPHPSFFMGYNMAERGESPIYYADKEWAKMTARGNDETVNLSIYTHGITFSSIEIFRDTDADPEGRVSIGSLTSNGSLVDSNVDRDITYYYWAEIHDSSNSNITFEPVSAKLTSTWLPVYSVSGRSAENTLFVRWQTENIDIGNISIYRVAAPSASDTPDFANRTLVANPATDSTSWEDTTSEDGQAYFYWVEFTDATSGTVFTPDPVWVKNIKAIIMELNAEVVDGAPVVTWRLDNYEPPVSYVELYRYKGNLTDPRLRVWASAPFSGTFIDNTPKMSAAQFEPAEEGVRYWYTLKVYLQDNSRPAIPLAPEDGLVIPAGTGQELLGAWAEVLSVREDGTPQIQVSWHMTGVDPVSIDIYRIKGGDLANAELAGTITDMSLRTWEDLGSAATPAHSYLLKLTDSNNQVHEFPVTNAVSLPPETNLASVQVGSNIEVSWNLRNFAPIRAVELYRNTSNAVGGRTRIAQAQPQTGTFVDTTAVVGQPYWYMFKLFMVDGTIVNTNPQAPITKTE